MKAETLQPEVEAAVLEGLIARTREGAIVWTKHERYSGLGQFWTEWDATAPGGIVVTLSGLGPYLQHDGVYLDLQHRGLIEQLWAAANASNRAREERELAARRDEQRQDEEAKASLLAQGLRDLSGVSCVPPIVDIDEGAEGVPQYGVAQTIPVQPLTPAQGALRDAFRNHDFRASAGAEIKPDLLAAWEALDREAHMRAIAKIDKGVEA